MMVVYKYIWIANIKESKLSLMDQAGARMKGEELGCE